MDSLKRLSIGGSTQWALVRGRDATRPVLLLVQAGPGFPMIHAASAIERALRLESRFRVVYWDQRGAGKSFAGAAGAGPRRLDDLVGDAQAVLELLASRLGVAAVDVVGFSLAGSAAGVAAAREPARFRSLVMVGADIQWQASERFAYEFALEESRRRDHRRVLRALRRIGPPSLLADLQGLDLAALAPRLMVPVALFQGRHDVAAPPHLAERYFRDLEAPRGKRWVRFEDSAHMPHLKEPERFRAEWLATVEGSDGDPRGAFRTGLLAEKVGAA